MEPTWSPKRLKNRTLGRPAEHEPDMLFTAFEPHGAPQGRSQTRAKIEAKFGTPSGADCCRF